MDFAPRRRRSLRAHRVEALLNLARSTGAELVADNIVVEDGLSGRRKLGFSLVERSLFHLT